MAGPSAPSSAWLYEIFAHQVLLRLEGDAVQWKYDTQDDSAWQTLYTITDLQGEQGIQGIQGPIGETGPAGAAGVVQSIVAGTNVSVDSTDPANPIISASGGGGGGGGGLTLVPSTLDISTYYSNAFNMLLNQVKAKQAIDIVGAAVGVHGINAPSGSKFKFVIYKIIDATGEVLEVHETPEVTVAWLTSASFQRSLQFKFNFPVSLTPSDALTSYLFGVVRTDGTTTTPVQVHYRTTVMALGWQMFESIGGLVANSMGYAVGENVPISPGSFSCLAILYANYSS